MSQWKRHIKVIIRGQTLWGQGREMTQALYAHTNNKTIKKKEVKLWNLTSYVESWQYLLQLTLHFGYQCLCKVEKKTVLIWEDDRTGMKIKQGDMYRVCRVLSAI
jgi:hypothetical protein